MHIGIIPDGNRRYMRKTGIPTLKESYRAGIQKFHDFLEWCMDLGVKEVTIYVLSTENLKNRSKLEINTLLNLFAVHAQKILSDSGIRENGIRINVCGDRQYLKNFGNPIGDKVVNSLEKLESSTWENSALVLNLAIAYGGRQELLHAIQELESQGLEINEENLRKNLWVKSYPDIIIRTAESRLSNFLLWQCAYSEIYFVEKLWQEFSKDDLKSIIDCYNSSERRFGQ